ncbi:MAG: helix-turn-helix domain-containing protein [Aquaticitalea sp.]
MIVLKKKISRQDSSCPVIHTQQFIGGKWRIAILWSLKHESKRFGQIKKELGTVSEKMLNQELKHLQNMGAIKRKSFNEMPPRVEYSLKDKGQSLISVIEHLISWGQIDMDNQKIKKSKSSLWI